MTPRPIRRLLRAVPQAALAIISAMAILLPAMRSNALHLTVGLLFLLEAGLVFHQTWRAGLLRLSPRALYAHFRASGQPRHRPLAALALWLGLIAVAVIRW